MYKIENIRQLLELPKHMAESSHLSQFLTRNSQEVLNTSKVQRLEKRILRTASTCFTVFTIDGVEVWAKQEEAAFMLEILPKVKDRRITMWHLVGSTTPFTGVERAIGLDGYEVHVLYNEK